MCLGNMSLKRKAFFILLDDMKITFSLTFFDKMEKCPLTSKHLSLLMLDFCVCV